MDKNKTFKFDKGLLENEKVNGGDLYEASQIDEYLTEKEADRNQFIEEYLLDQIKAAYAIHFEEVKHIGNVLRKNGFVASDNNEELAGFIIDTWEDEVNYFVEVEILERGNHS